MFITKRFLSLIHKPVMPNEIIDLLKPINKTEKIYLDMTFGNGGHSKLLLDAHESVQVYGLDRDQVANTIGLQFIKQYKKRFIMLNGTFTDIKNLLPNKLRFDGILFDLGCSSMQFDDLNRGFSLSKDGSLDMRMDIRSGVSAKDAINHLSAEDLFEVIYKYGEEPQAEKIANAIVNARKNFGPIKTTYELANIIESAFFKFDLVGNVTNTSVYGRDKLGRHSHVATKTFQALRIFVNDELNQLDLALRLCHSLLKSPYQNTTTVSNESREIYWATSDISNTRADLYDTLKLKSPHNLLAPNTTLPLCVVLSFHSLEDRLVKNHFQGHLDVNQALENSIPTTTYPASKTTLKQKFRPGGNDDLAAQILGARRWVPFNKKVIEASSLEVDQNPRARSAKLRAAYKAS